MFSSSYCFMSPAMCTEYAFIIYYTRICFNYFTLYDAMYLYRMNEIDKTSSSIYNGRTLCSF